MSDGSTIEWTDATWNPVRGCTKVSPGCKRCYAEVFAERFRGVEGHPFEQGFDLKLVPDKLDVPLRWLAPRRVFVNSMSDLFHENVPDEYIAAVFGIMAACPRHTFQVLTKRAERLCDWNAGIGEHPLFKTRRGVPHVGAMADHAAYIGGIKGPVAKSLNGPSVKPPSWPLSNVWLGVSVEDRKYGLPRIEHLRKTPAAMRFLSVEPLLEDLGAVDLTGIGWVIVGGESGHGARPMHEDWVRSLRDQCIAAGVRFFYKQRVVNRRKVSLPMLDGQRWSQFPGVSP